MEVFQTNDLTGRLIFALKKITESKKFDIFYSEKFLVCINQEFSNGFDYVIHIPEFSEWLLGTFQKWKQTNSNVSKAIFLCRFIGILTKYEQGFNFLLNSNILSMLSTTLESDAYEQTALTPVYICFLSDVLTHTPGYEWIKNTKQWKTVTKLYFSKSNLYVEREGLNFLKTFINKVAFDDEANNEIFQEIFLSTSKCAELNIEDKNLCSVTVRFLKLIEALLETQIFFENSFFSVEVLKAFNLQVFLNFLLENCKKEVILDKASALQVLFFVVQYEDKRELLSLEDLPRILDFFYVMLKKNQFNGIIKLAKYCQVLWSEMRNRTKCESKAGVHFIVVQLLPALICIKPPDTALCDLYIQKLFSLTTIKAQKFCYLLRDEIRIKISPKPKNLALKGILSVINNTECLNLEEAVLIFQAMAYLLKSFIPDKSCAIESFNFNEANKETSLCVQDTALLSAVLNALCIFIEKFKIKWSESLESLCLLKMTCVLLENPNLPSTVVVQVFLLLKLAILNFMSPDLALLMNDTKNSSFGGLMTLLFKRLHDPNWEIRDSCLEVVTAVAELSESKYPAFEQLLIEKKFYSLVFDIMEGDSESYVRASAIQALRAMLKVKSLYQFLINMEISRKIIKLLQEESEAIVRREAALIIKQIYLTLNDPHNEIAKYFYKVMGYSAICDLHWEVKVNSLIFWEAVIQRIIADQGMIDGSFPNVTFSKEHKKIVILTQNEVKLRLDKVLEKLSEVGCLYVLLSSLNDDCDMSVVRKSAEILSDFMTILKRYGVIETFRDTPIIDGIPIKRKNIALDKCEKRKSLSFQIEKSSYNNLNKTCSISFNNNEPACSDAVIDEIVNENDINLLGNVCFQKCETAKLQKKVLLQEIKPESFLLQMQNFDLEKFLEDKQKWLINLEVDFKSLLLEICTMNFTDETNKLDCY